MILEVALITVTDRDGFIAAYRGVREIVTSSPGCRSVRMTAGVESPHKFTLIIEWDSLEAHTEGFRASDAFTQWRAAIGPFFAEPPIVEHFTDVD